MVDFPDEFDACGYCRPTGGVRAGSTMRAVWLVVALLVACEPPTITVCENRGSDPTGPTQCADCACENDDGSVLIDYEACTDARCVCRERTPPAMVLSFHDADCSACGLYCEAPQLPCGARCVGPDEACPDRPSPWACRTREVPVE